MIQLQDERLKREQEIREEEALRPAREAAQMAAEQVAALENFHDGHEWWGSYLWTVENPQAELMIGLAASATD